MKRYLSWLLAACLCLSLMPTALAAGTELNVTAPEKLPAVGETFTVTVDVSGNTGFTALELTFGYDKEVVKCLDASIGTALRGTISATNPNASAGAKIAAASTSEVKADGTLVTLTFEVLANGDAELTLGTTELFDAAGASVPYTVTGADQIPQEPEEDQETESVTPDKKPVKPEKPEKPEEDL